MYSPFLFRPRRSDSVLLADGIKDDLVALLLSDLSTQGTFAEEWLALTPRVILFFTHKTRNMFAGSI